MPATETPQAWCWEGVFQFPPWLALAPNPSSAGTTLAQHKSSAGSQRGNK